MIPDTWYVYSFVMGDGKSAPGGTLGSDPPEGALGYFARGFGGPLSSSVRGNVKHDTARHDSDLRIPDLSVCEMSTVYTARGHVQ